MDRIWLIQVVMGGGVGKKMGLHSLNYAFDQGFKGLQFNLVVSTNEAAIGLWEKIGFRIIGTVPGAFNHQSIGYVDAHIMFRDLSDMGQQAAGGDSFG